MTAAQRRESLLRGNDDRGSAPGSTELNGMSRSEPNQLDGNALSRTRGGKAANSGNALS